MNNIQKKEMSIYPKIEQNIPVLFQQKSKKIITKSLTHINNDTGKSRHFTPASQEWFNSVYSFNTNYIKDLPVKDKNLMKLLKAYFNFQLKKQYTITKRLVTRFKRLSTKRIFIGKGEIKHSFSNIIITFYVHNTERFYLNKAIKVLRRALYNPITPLRKYVAIDIYNNVRISYNRSFSLKEYLTLPKFYLNYLKKYTKKQITTINVKDKDNLNLDLEFLNINLLNTDIRNLSIGNLNITYNIIRKMIIFNKNLYNNYILSNNKDSLSLIKLRLTVWFSASENLDVIYNIINQLNNTKFKKEKLYVIKPFMPSSYYILKNKTINRLYKKNLSVWHIRNETLVLEHLASWVSYDYFNPELFKKYQGFKAMKYKKHLTNLKVLLELNKNKFMNPINNNLNLRLQKLNFFIPRIKNYIPKFDKFIFKLIGLVQKIYKKKVLFNIINLKFMHLNSDIYTQAVALKLRNRNNKLYRVLKSSLRKVKLPRISKLAEVYNNINKDELLVNRIRNDNISSMFSDNKTNDPLSSLLLNFFPDANNIWVNVAKMSSIKRHNISIQSYVKRLLKHLNIRGVRVEAKGRITRRLTASRSVFKMKYKGGLKNVDSSFKRLSTITLRGNFKSNVQYTFISSKNRNGAYGVKGWVSSK